MAATHNKIFASGQAIPDAEHRGITPDLTRLASEPDAKIEEAKGIRIDYALAA